ncbi:hypothetical protein Tco_0921674 [Tanacetum coccineum]
MSTSKTYQQSLADAGSETRPPMLERGSYIPWAILKLQTAKDLQGDALLHYDAEMELMNLILISIPNDIYNSFVAEPGEALVSVYNRFAQLMNDLERNDMHFPIQFEKLVNVSRAKKLEKAHDPLALVADNTLMLSQAMIILWLS